MRYAFAIFVASCVTLNLAGQSPPALSLQQARELALKNHPQVLAAEANYLRADQITREAKSAYYPLLSGALTAGQANADTRLGAGVLNDPRLFTHAGAGLALSQLITDSGRTSNLVASAKLSAMAGREDARTIQDNVILNVDRAYYEVLLARQLVKVARQTVSTRQTVVDQISELTKNRLRSDVDLSFARVNFADAKLMLLRAQDRVESAYANLAEAIGAQQIIRYEMFDEPMPAAGLPDMEKLVNDALQKRPEMASLYLQVESDEKFAAAERDLKLPTVSLLAVGGALPYIVPGNANPNIPKGYESAAINLSVPIFNGHLFSARRQAAEYQLQQARQRLRDEQNMIARDVRTAWAHAQTAFEAIGTAEQLLIQANLALDLAQGRYKLGLASIVELTQAQLSQTTAQVENLSARYEYQEAYATLQYEVGLLH